MESTVSVHNRSESTVWLSGEVATLANKLIIPTVWVAILAGVLLSVFVNISQLAMTRQFSVFALLGITFTGFMIWMSTRIQRVGYADGELIIASYLRDVRVPFRQVEAIEPVWWLRTRMVRIRFSEPNRFGRVVYYMPKWTLGVSVTTPEQELRDVLMQAGVLT